MTIDLHEYNILMERLREIESVDLEDLHVLWEGEEINKDEASPISVEDFKFTGLMNRDFLEILLNEVLIS